MTDLISHCGKKDWKILWRFPKKMLVPPAPGILADQPSYDLPSFLEVILDPVLQ
jgi:hypothetical protein